MIVMTNYFLLSIGVIAVLFFRWMADVHQGETSSGDEVSIFHAAKERDRREGVQCGLCDIMSAISPHLRA